MTSSEDLTGLLNLSGLKQKIMAACWQEQVCADECYQYRHKAAHQQPGRPAVSPPGGVPGAKVKGIDEPGDE
jgi:hypothetical protein